MTEPTLVSDPSQVTSEWLTRVLQYAGIDGRVDSFNAKSIGTGQVGENVRFELQGSGAIPRTVVGKFPSSDPVSRQTGIDLGNYIREVHFYRNLQDSVDIQTPHDLFSAIDEKTHDFVVVMEDLAPGQQGDQIAGCSIEQAELALTELARLHGPRWGDETLLVPDLVVASDEDRAINIKGMYDLLAPGFVDRYGARLDENETEMVRQVGEHMMAYSMNYRGPLTLIHIDYRLDNMMFGGPYPLAVVDWQSIAFGCALNDAAYFVGTSVREEERAGAEKSLLQNYHNELMRYEVSLSFDECWHYYRHHAPAGLIMAVIASMIVSETDRGNDMFMAMAKRSARMCLELDSISAITNQ